MVCKPPTEPEGAECFKEIEKAKEKVIEVEINIAFEELKRYVKSHSDFPDYLWECLDGDHASGQDEIAIESIIAVCTNDLHLRLPEDIIQMLRSVDDAYLPFWNYVEQAVSKNQSLPI